MKDSYVPPMRNLETKRETILQLVSKYCGIYTTVCDVDESQINEDDGIEKAKTLYQQSSKGNKPFTIMECWKVLRNALKWKSH